MPNISLSRDNNRIAVIGGTSSSDGVTPVAIYADPTTHRLLVDTNSTANNFADGEIPTGAINGINVTFTLANTPSPVTSLQFFVSGQLLAPVGVDYTLVGSTITLNTPPTSGQPVICWYRY